MIAIIVPFPNLDRNHQSFLKVSMIDALFYDDGGKAVSISAFDKGKMSPDQGNIFPIHRAGMCGYEMSRFRRNDNRNVNVHSGYGCKTPRDVSGFRYSDQKGQTTSRIPVIQPGCCLALITPTPLYSIRASAI